MSSPLPTTLLLLMLLLGFSPAKPEEQATTLQLVFVVFRHGERVPETNEQFPNDSHKIEAFYPLTYGEITNEGKRRQYRLGEKLRKRYAEFLGPVYAAEHAATYSTDWDRTKTSALLTLAGLFPPHQTQQWHSDLKWLPIPYSYKPTQQDFLIRRPDPYCPRYVEELEKVFASEDAGDVYRKYRETFDYVTEASGRNMSDFHEMFRVYQNIHSKKVLNMSIPEWALSVYPEPLQTIASYQCVFENYNDVLKRLNGGHILQKFIEIAGDKARGELKPPGRKIYLYSGHENNVVNVLSVLRVYEQHLPPYCSAVLLELHRAEDDPETYGFKIYYDNSTYTDEVHELVMPGCTPFCPFDAFVEITKLLVPVNYTAECESSVFLD